MDTKQHREINTLIYLDWFPLKKLTKLQVILKLHQGNRHISRHPGDHSQLYLERKLCLRNIHTDLKDHYQAFPLSGSGRDWHTLHPFWGWRHTGRHQWPSAHGGCEGQAISTGDSKWRGADPYDETPGDDHPVTWRGWVRKKLSYLLKSWQNIITWEGWTKESVFSLISGLVVCIEATFQNKTNQRKKKSC